LTFRFFFFFNCSVPVKSPPTESHRPRTFLLLANETSLIPSLNHFQPYKASLINLLVWLRLDLALLRLQLSLFRKRTPRQRTCTSASIARTPQLIFVCRFEDSESSSSFEGPKAIPREEEIPPHDFEIPIPLGSVPANMVIEPGSIAFKRVPLGRGHYGAVCIVYEPKLPICSLSWSYAQLFLQ